MVPSFLLKRLYVKGSLKNTENGFEFVLRNSIDSGTIVGVSSVAVDDTSHPPEAITLRTPRGEWRADEVSGRKPLFCPINTEIRIAVQGAPLTPGEHRVVIAVIAQEAGRLQVEFADTI